MNHKLTPPIWRERIRRLLDEMNMSTKSAAMLLEVQRLTLLDWLNEALPTRLDGTPPPSKLEMKGSLVILHRERSRVCKSQRRSKERWTTVDWSQSTKTIAEFLGVSREAVRKQREKRTTAQNSK